MIGRLEELKQLEKFYNSSKFNIMFFSKSGFTEPVKERAERENAVLLTVEDLYL